MWYIIGFAFMCLVFSAGLFLGIALAAGKRADEIYEDEQAKMN